LSPNKRSTDNLLRRYLNGALTAPEEAELERRALTDEPLTKAMQGLQAHPETDHEAHVARMLKGARSQVQGRVGGAKIRPLHRNYARFAAAASVVILFVFCALWLLPLWVEIGPVTMSMNTSTEAPATAEPLVAANDKAKARPKPQTMTVEQEPEFTPPAPSSSTPNLRPRPNTESTADQKAKTQTNERTATKAKRNQTTLRETNQKERIAAAKKMKRLDEKFLAEEATITKSAPSPVPQVVTALMDAPKPSVSTDEAARRFKIEPSVNNGPVANGKGRGKYLKGRITNENGVPILSALVRLTGLPLGERTDSSGYFSLPSDATTTRLEVSHPDYENETVDLRTSAESLQISLDRKDWQAEARPGLLQNAAQTIIILDNKPGYAAPLEGYATLRKRIQANRPADVPKGKVKFSFTVNADGTLTDFEFRGRPNQITMNYIGKTLIKSSTWEITQGEEPVRIYMKVVF
jgi:hypothetical protein